MAGLKTYTPLDLEGNRITNIGDPLDPADAVNKRFLAVTTPGDTLYVGGALHNVQPGPFSTGGGGAYIGARVTGVTTGVTVHVAWEARSIGAANEQHLFGFQTGLPSVVASSVAADLASSSWTAYSADLVMSGGATEIQLWTTVNAAEFRNLEFTQPLSQFPERLPIGAEGSAMIVANGLPVWGPAVGRTFTFFGG